MSESLLIGVIILLILSITFEWTWISQRDIDNILWKSGLGTLQTSLGLFGKPDYINIESGGTALWKNPGGVEKSELIITDNTSANIRMSMQLDIFDADRRNDVMVDEREFYRMLLMIHKIDSNIFYDATMCCLWIKSNSLNQCLHTALLAKNMDLRPVPDEFDFDFISV